MDYKRKPLASYNQIPQQKIKKRDAFAKSNDFKINDHKTKDKTENKITEVFK